MTHNWKVTVNGVVFEVKATNAWTATTRAIKGYWKHRQNIASLNRLNIDVVKEPRK